MVKKTVDFKEETYIELKVLSARKQWKIKDAVDKAINLLLESENDEV